MLQDAGIASYKSSKPSSQFWREVQAYVLRTANLGCMRGSIESSAVTRRARSSRLEDVSTCRLYLQIASVGAGHFAIVNRVAGFGFCVKP